MIMEVKVLVKKLSGFKVSKIVTFYYFGFRSYLRCVSWLYAYLRPLQVLVQLRCSSTFLAANAIAAITTPRNVSPRRNNNVKLNTARNAKMSTRRSALRRKSNVARPRTKTNAHTRKNKSVKPLTKKNVNQLTIMKRSAPRSPKKLANMSMCKNVKMFRKRNATNTLFLNAKKYPNNIVPKNTRRSAKMCLFKYPSRKRNPPVFGPTPDTIKMMTSVKNVGNFLFMIIYYYCTLLSIEP